LTFANNLAFYLIKFIYLLDQIKEEIEIIKIDNEKKNVDDDKDY